MDPANVSDMNRRSVFPAQTPIGMAYVPLQRFGPLYEPAMALRQGTIFPELDMPWYGMKAFPSQRRMTNPAVSAESNMENKENMKTTGNMGTMGNMGNMGNMGTMGNMGNMKSIKNAENGNRGADNG